MNDSIFCPHGHYWHACGSPACVLEGERLDVKRNTRMRVRDLIEKLQELDQDKYIVIGGYEGGCDFPNHFSKVQIALDQHTAWYYGKHEYVTPRDDEYVEGEWNAYVIINKE